MPGRVALAALVLAAAGALAQPPKLVLTPSAPVDPGAKREFSVRGTGDEVFIVRSDRADTFIRLYRLDDREPGIVRSLTYLDRFDVLGQATSADVSEDGLRLTLLTDIHLWIFERRNLVESFFSGRIRRIDYRHDASGTNLESIRSADIPELRPARPLLAASHGNPAHDLRVTSFNLRFASADDGPNSWNLRRNRVGTAIRGWNADIIGLQEVEATQANWLHALLPTHTFHGVGRRDGASEGEFAPVLFRKDRFALEAAGHFWLSPTPDVVGSKGWDAALERIASWVRLSDRHTRQRLLVINTHLDHRGTQARAESLALLRDRAAALADGAAVIITGDFNTSADAPPATTILAANRESTLSLYDTFRRVYPIRDSDEATFSTWNTPPAISGDRIDWILASGDLETIAAQIDRRTPRGRLLSDHYPIHARLRYADQPPAPSR